MNINIREAKENDLSIIRKLALDIWPKTYAPILSQNQINYMLRLFYSDEALHNDFHKKGYRFFILNVDGTDIGYAGVEQKNEQTWHFHKIYLSQQLHGQGLGKQLIRHVEDFARRNGGQSITLGVNRNNKARLFYEKQGYEIRLQEDTDIGSGFFMNDYRNPSANPILL